MKPISMSKQEMAELDGYMEEGVLKFEDGDLRLIEGLFEYVDEEGNIALLKMTDFGTAEMRIYCMDDGEEIDITEIMDGK